MLKNITIFILGTFAGYYAITYTLPTPSERELMFHTAGYNAGFYDAAHGIYSDKGE